MFNIILIIIICLINYNSIKFNDDLLLNIILILFFMIIYICFKHNIKVSIFLKNFKLYFIYRLLFIIKFYYIKENLYLLSIKKNNIIKLKYKFYYLYKYLFNKLDKLLNNFKYIFIDTVLEINIYLKLFNLILLNSELNGESNDYISSN